MSFMVDGTPTFGRVVGIREAEGEVDVDDFGRGTTIFDDKVVQRMAIQSADASPLDAYLDQYRIACVESGAEPRWADLVEAAAKVAAAGDVPVPTAHTLYINGAVAETASGAATPAEA